MSDTPPLARVYFLSAGAVGGAAVLALEVLAARTMAPAVGSGPTAWSALLAVALGSLAAGNLLGGAVADRWRPDAVVPWALAVAALALVGFSQVWPGVMAWAVERSLVLGALTAAAATQCVPMLMLGVITPPIVRAGQSEGRGGRWAGAVLASGSGGGIAGSLLMGLYLLPAAGVSRSYLVVAAALAVAALPGAWWRRRWMAVLLAVAALVVAGVCWHRAGPPRAIQSRCGQIEVRTVGGTRVLLVDGLPQTAMPEAVVPGDGLRHGYLLELALFFDPRPRTALVVGLGAGLAPRLLEAHGLRCESVELDPQIVQVARAELGFDGDVAVCDGRAFLRRSRDRWDLIVLDVCTADRLPSHLFTVEALTDVRRHLTPEGVVAIQFIGDDGPWSASLARTAQHVFGWAFVLAPAGVRPAVGPRWLFTGLALPPPLDEPRDPSAFVPWRVVRVEQKGDLLTDDHFPAELAWARVAAQWRRHYALAE